MATETERPNPLELAMVEMSDERDQLVNNVVRCAPELVTAAEAYDDSLDEYTTWQEKNPKSAALIDKAIVGMDNLQSLGSIVDGIDINVLTDTDTDKDVYAEATSNLMAANHGSWLTPEQGEYKWGADDKSTIQGNLPVYETAAAQLQTLVGGGAFIFTPAGVVGVAGIVALAGLGESPLDGARKMHDLLQKMTTLQAKSMCIFDAHAGFVNANDDVIDELNEATAADKRAAGIDSDAEEDAIRRQADAQRNIGNAARSEIRERQGQSPQFLEQCWLLSNIFDLVNYKRNVIEKTSPKILPYKNNDTNACLMAHGDPYGFLNNLTQHPSQFVFFDMENKDISTLQPQIHLFKVNMDEDDSGQILETEQPITFASHAEWDLKFLKDKTKRGFGAGIKDFSFTYDGNNPFAVKKSISAKLNIFANSFDELFKDRGGYRYIDLALKTGTAKQGAEVEKTKEMQKIIEENLEKLNFRLKAVVGWAIPNGNLNHFGGGTTFGATYSKENLKDAIYDSYVTLNLTPTIHEFKIDQMGRVNFIIDYLAYVEDFFEQPNFNVFFNANSLTKRLKRKLKYKKLSATGKCNAEDMADIKKAEIEENEITWERQESLRSIMKGLLTGNKVNFINISHEEVENFNISGPYANQGNFDTSRIKTDQSLNLGLAKALEGEYRGLSADEDEREMAFALASISPMGDQISFFYVSDLIDVILKGIDTLLSGAEDKLGEIAETEEVKTGKILKKDIAEEIKRYRKLYLNFKKLRVLLGPLEIVNHADGGTSTFVNLGDVPISVKYFISWLTAKVLKKEESIYPLSQFLNDFFNNLLKEFLNNETCFNRQVKQATRLNQAVITSYRNPKSDHDEITDIIMEQGNSRADINNITAPIFNVSGYNRNPDGGNPSSDDAGISREINYFTFFAGRTQPAEYMNGDRQEDEARGIFHYMLGKNRGIVKTINLSKTDAKFLKETRFQEEGYDGLEQLREVYDVEIETYANVKTFPGTYIFVDPHGFAPNTISDEGVFDLTQYGIGGYCMIYRSTTTLGEGQANTKISAKWVASIGAKGTTEIVKKEEEKVDKVCPQAEAARRSNKNDTSWWESVKGVVTGG